MNKHLFRVIFNKTRGIFMVVAEIAKRNQGEAASSEKKLAKNQLQSP